MKSDLDRGYSQYWRKNNSPVEMRELAFLLKALRKVASHITDWVKPVEWDKISFSGDKNKILLDLSFVAGQYPVPPEKVGVLVGWVAHEAFHTREMTDMVLYKAREYKKEFSSEEKAAFLELIGAGEDVYINYKARGTIWEFYLERMWRWYYPRIKGDDASSLRLLLDLWRKIFFQEQFTLPPELTPYQEPLNLLITYGQRLIETSEEDSPAQRAEERFKIYCELWPLFHPFVKNWGDTLDSGNLPLFHHDFVPEYSSVPRRMDLEELEEILADQEEDLSSRIRAMVEDKSHAIPTVFWEKQTTPCNVLPDPSISRKLKSIFESLEQKNKVNLRFINRGLLFGKLDGRRLHKTFIDGKVFKEKEYEGSKLWEITILVDGSRSMVIDKHEKVIDNWYNVEKTFCPLQEAAKGYENPVNLFAYYEQAGRCFVANLLQNNRLYTIFPKGKTPSGQAIMAVALSLKKGPRTKNLLLHITDGEANCGIDVVEAVQYCEKQGIDLMTIGCGYDEELKDYFVMNYNNVYLMDNFEELPNALETLLKRTLLK